MDESPGASTSSPLSTISVSKSVRRGVCVIFTNSITQVICDIHGSRLPAPACFWGDHREGAVALTDRKKQMVSCHRRARPCAWSSRRHHNMITVYCLRSFFCFLK